MYKLHSSDFRMLCISSVAYKTVDFQKALLHWDNFHHSLKKRLIEHTPINFANLKSKKELDELELFVRARRVLRVKTPSIFFHIRKKQEIELQLWAFSAG